MNAGCCLCFQTASDADIWADEHSVLPFIEKPSCYAIPPDVALMVVDECLEMTSDAWTILEDESSTLQTPTTSEERSRGLPSEDSLPMQTHNAYRQNAVEPRSLVARLAAHFQKAPLLNRLQLKSLRTGMTGAADVPVSDAVSTGETVDHNEWEHAGIKVTNVNLEGACDLGCKPRVAWDVAHQPMPPSSMSEEQQRSSSFSITGHSRHTSTSNNAEGYGKKHRSWVSGVVQRPSSNGCCWLDCKHYASVLSIRSRGARSMPTRTGTASWTSRSVGSPTKPSQDNSSFTVGERVEYNCKLPDGWVNATIISSNADGSYTLDVKVDASPTKLRRPSEEIFTTLIAHDALTTRLPAELLQDGSSSGSGSSSACGGSSDKNHN